MTPCFINESAALSDLYYILMDSNIKTTLGIVQKWTVPSVVLYKRDKGVENEKKIDLINKD